MIRRSKSAIRSRRGNIETATDIYTKGERCVAVIGVCHIADPSFWQTISKRIDGYEGMGYTVHYEKVRRASIAAPEGKDQSTSKPFRKLAKLTGLQFQSDGLAYPDHWVNTDMSADDIKSLGVNTLDEMESVSSALDDISESRHRNLWGSVIKVMLRLTLMRSNLIARRSSYKKVIIDLRNVVAAEAALSTDSNVVSIWGAAHLPGIGALLVEEGFEHESRVWNRVISR